MRIIKTNHGRKKTAVLKRLLGLATFLCAGWLTTLSAHAQLAQGFQLNAYEPTPAGEWSFGVPHPWYSGSFAMPRYFAGGLTLNYNHNPLVFFRRDPATGELIKDPSDIVVQHQLLAHLDLAFSFLDRINLSASVPFTLLERGNDLSATAGVKPIDGMAVGDPRIGLMIRLFGQPYRSPISLSVGGYVWVPVNKYTNAFPAQVGETEWRGLPMLVLSGLAKRIMWSLSAGFYFRPEAQIGNLTEGSADKMGSQMQFGAAIAYADINKRFSIGAEAWANTAVLGANAFTSNGTGLEILPLAFNYNIGRYVNVGAAAGFALLHQPGTPDARALLRVAYAPMRDARSDRDKDGVYDEEDLCPDTHKGNYPDPNRKGCPNDRDRDMVLDQDDQCIDDPIKSRQTPNAPDGDNNRLGCPLQDRDTDGVYDRDDLCPDQPIRSPMHPDAPEQDPARRGCPKRPVLQVTSSAGKATVFEKIYFEKDSDKLMIDERRAVAQARGETGKQVARQKVAATQRVLQAVLSILQSTTPADWIQKGKPLGILAYADKDAPGGKDPAAYNQNLTQRRSEAVKKYLMTEGISENQLVAVGCGYFDDGNNAPENMEKHRRVEFLVGEKGSISVTDCDAAAIRP